jgi:hypothetical protein
MGVRTGLESVETTSRARPAAPAARTRPEPQPKVKRAAARGAGEDAVADDRRGWLVRLTRPQRLAAGEFCLQRDMSQQEMLLLGMDMVLRAAGMRPLPEFEAPPDFQVDK